MSTSRDTDISKTVVNSLVLNKVFSIRTLPQGLIVRSCTDTGIPTAVGVDSLNLVTMESAT